MCYFLFSRLRVCRQLVPHADPLHPLLPPPFLFPLRRGRSFCLHCFAFSKKLKKCSLLNLSQIPQQVMSGEKISKNADRRKISLVKLYHFAFCFQLTIFDLSIISIGIPEFLLRISFPSFSVGNSGWSSIDFRDLSSHLVNGRLSYVSLSMNEKPFDRWSISLPLLLSLVKLPLLAQAVGILMLVSCSMFNDHVESNQPNYPSPDLALIHCPVVDP